MDPTVFLRPHPVTNYELLYSPLQCKKLARAPGGGGGGGRKIFMPTKREGGGGVWGRLNWSNFYFFRASQQIFNIAISTTTIPKNLCP